MEIKETVCAVVVTYNRKELLIECLDALLKQTRPIDAMYIIDNFSNDGTSELLKEKGYITELPPENIRVPWEKEFEVKNLLNGSSVKVYYMRMNENIGGAGGFHEGVKRGYERGYDWLWLMDDDAEPDTESLYLLSKHFEDQSIVGLAGTVLRPDNSIAINHRGKVDYTNMFPLIEKPLDEIEYTKSSCDIHVASFVGLLIRSTAVKKIGYPNKEYFIHNDDFEYCLRLSKVGKIKLIPSSKILHKEASKQTIKERVPLSKLWLSYYGRRNQISLVRKYSTNKLKLYFQILISLSRSIVGIILYDDHKIKRIKFVISSVLDGFTDTFDNDKPKRILGLK
ncbi:glycosyltransferase family 2 protein [Petrotoga halophila]|jgi:GT2 family glycosyltransferase|uniref:Family 2 glycosyl transferase n=1 Tax=Petrotoga halophila DSM 16923 TaxID=1122953 RepID=A0A2S5E9C4_9BACT|nr:glycosyltransferase family 2 protein [Petrotoga halophila]POZ89637.1 family 2 glycosyl transferase [Petrotoga halophila DSM 16923]